MTIKRLQLKTRPALTLIELLVSLGILVVIVLVVINIFITTAHFTSSEQSRIEVGTSASRLFSNLDEVIRQGRQVLSSATIGGTTYTTSDTTLVLAVPALVGGNITGNDDIFVITLDQASGQLDQILSPFVDVSNHANDSTRVAGTITLATNVSSLYFRYTTDDPVQATNITATMVTQRTITGQPFTQKAIIHATLRNHV